MSSGRLANERPKQVLQVGLQRVTASIIRPRARLIRKGILGKVTNVQAQWHRKHVQPRS